MTLNTTPRAALMLLLFSCRSPEAGMPSRCSQLMRRMGFVSLQPAYKWSRRKGSVGPAVNTLYKAALKRGPGIAGAFATGEQFIMANNNALGHFNGHNRKVTHSKVLQRLQPHMLDPGSSSARKKCIRLHTHGAQCKRRPELILKTSVEAWLDVK